MISKSLFSTIIFILALLSINSNAEEITCLHISEEACNHMNSRVFEDQALALIHTLILNGSTKFSIPPLDPLDYEGNIHIDKFNFATYLALDYANLAGIHSTKLNDFDVNSFHINIAPIGAEFNFTFPEINANLEHYNISGVLIDTLPFDGDGDLTVTVSDVVISGSITIGVRNDTSTIYLSGMSLDLVVGGVKLHVSGLMGGSRITEMASEAVTDGGPRLIELLKGLVGPQLVDTLKEQINVLLDELGLTAGDILSCIQAGNCFN